MLDLFCGIDWGEQRHDVAVVDHIGTVVAKAKISNDAAGFAALLELLALVLQRQSRDT